MSAKKLKYITYQEAIMINDAVQLGNEPRAKKIIPLKDLLGPNILKPHKIYKPKPPKVVSYDEARRVLYGIYRSFLQGRPVFEENQKSIVKNVLKYFINDNTSSYDLKKGLYIFGDYGCGKSLLLKCFLKFTKDAVKAEMSNVNTFRFYEYENLLNDAKEEGNTTLVRRLGKDAAIDDLGYQGQSKISIFGNKEDFVTSIVKARHSLFMNRKCKSYFTSNLTPEILKKNHSEGTSSRIEEMCNIIFWDGQNLRK